MTLGQVGRQGQAFDSLGTLDAEDSGTDYDEPTIIEYARYHGLSIDYLAEHPFDQAALESQVADLSLDYACGFFPGDADLLKPSLCERLAISQDAMELLRSACASSHDCGWDEPEAQRRPKPSQLKIELPVLFFDNDYDLLHFGRKAEVSLANIRLPPEPVQDEKHEGLAWPSECLELPKRLETGIRQEKLEIPQGSINCLKCAFKLPSPSMTQKESLCFDLAPVKSKPVRRLTPPLLPLSLPPSPFKAVSPSGALEPLPGTTDPTVDQARRLEKKLMDQDGLCPIGDPMHLDNDGQTSISKPLSDLELPSSTPPKRKLKDLRVEGPLTPPLLTDVPLKRSKTFPFSESLHEYIPDLASEFICDENLFRSSNDVDAIFDNELARFAGEAERELQSEQLSEADATKRVQVPQLEMIKPVPPWQQFLRSAHDSNIGADTEGAAQLHISHLIGEEGMRLVNKWHGQTKMERHLSWSPFPGACANVDMEERFEGAGLPLDDSRQKLNFSDIVTSSSLTWKPEGLRILNDTWDDIEDELELAEFEGDDAIDSDLDVLVRQKQMAEASSNRMLRHSIKLGFDQSEQAVREPTTSDGEMFGGLFSATNALAKYLESRGYKAKRLPLPLGETQAQAHERIDATSGDDATFTSVHDRERPFTALTALSNANFHALPRPTVVRNFPARAFIVSSTLLASSRFLIRQISILYPNSTFIERDFKSLEQGIPSSVGGAHPDASSPNIVADEGDIVLSPSTSILLTTLQKIKQRPLPGQKTSGGILERIATTRHRFERILVLVSEGASVSSQPQPVLDERDALALVDLQAFTSAIPADVQVLYIPGDESELAKWIAGAMQNSSFTLHHDDTFQLFQEETLWEQFLRRLGLNAFAAQMVLHALKLPDLSLTAATSSHAGKMIEVKAEHEVKERDQPNHGLCAFVMMSADDRLKRFAPLLGGRRVLARANVVLEQSFKSAVGKAQSD